MPKQDAVGQRRLTTVVILACLLFTVYMLTYTGVWRSTDEMSLLDTAESIARRGDLLLNETAFLDGFVPTAGEPAQPFLTAPLFWLGYHLPWAGNVHTMYLFNPLITALIAVLIFLYALERGYSERTALAAALLFGLTTIFWPYAQTFFREPLSALTLLAAAFFTERWRKSFAAGESHHWRRLIPAVAFTLAGPLVKEAALIAMPALLVLAYPGRGTLKKYRRQLLLAALGAGVTLIVVAGLLYLYQQGATLNRFRFAYQFARLVEGLSVAPAGMAGYLISPGKGIWWFSPILLLALFAPMLLPPARWQESYLPLGTLVWFALIYAAIKADGWPGGAGWGARFMLPVLPLLMTGAFPALDRILNAPRLWPKIALAVLALTGLIVQIGGLYVNIYDYYAEIEAHTGQYVWRGPAIWSLRWSQVIGSLLFLPHAATDLRWLRPTPDWLAIGVIAGLICLLVGALVWRWRRSSALPRADRAITAASPVLCFALSAFVLWRAFDDPRYQIDNTALAALVETLNRETGEGHAILLSTPAYVPHFFNYYKGGGDWYGLPIAPGERYSWEQTPAVVSDQVEELNAPATLAVFIHVIASGDLDTSTPLWLVMDNSPFHPWSVRPPERYLAEYTYTVGETVFSETVRLLEYIPLAAPSVADPPAIPISAHFDSVIELVGFDLDTNSSLEDLHPGDVLAISLLWRARETPPADYTVGMFVIGSDGSLVLQQDRQPVGGFYPTSSWQPRQIIRDNFGFILPADLPPAAYQLWVVLYQWPSLERLSVTGPSGEDWGDHAVLGTIEIR